MHPRPGQSWWGQPTRARCPTSVRATVSYSWSSRAESSGASICRYAHPQAESVRAARHVEAGSMQRRGHASRGDLFALSVLPRCQATKTFCKQ
eukprot:2694613-Pleurochrysis_carterae.AAC.2